MCARGSWKIIATWVRYRRRSVPVSPPTSAPSNRIEPWTLAPRGSRRPIARAAMVFPAPDSPTRPTASPGATVSETSRSTARWVPFTFSITLSPATSSSGALDAFGVARAVPAAVRAAHPRAACAWSNSRSPSTLTAITTTTMHTLAASAGSG